MVTVKFFGWNYDPTVNADKIWGWCDVDGKIYNFWGKRGTQDLITKNVAFKRWTQAQADRVKTVERSKIDKGYKPIDLTVDSQGNYPAIEAVYPNFVRRGLKEQLMLKRLSGDIMGED